VTVADLTSWVHISLAVTLYALAALLVTGGLMARWYAFGSALIASYILTHWVIDTMEGADPA